MKKGIKSGFLLILTLIPYGNSAVVIDDYSVDKEFKSSAVSHEEESLPSVEAKKFLAETIKSYIAAILPYAQSQGILLNMSFYALAPDQKLKIAYSKTSPSEYIPNQEQFGQDVNFVINVEEFKDFFAAFNHGEGLEESIGLFDRLISLVFTLFQQYTAQRVDSGLFNRFIKGELGEEFCMPPSDRIKIAVCPEAYAYFEQWLRYNPFGDIKPYLDAIVQHCKNELVRLAMMGGDSLNERLLAPGVPAVLIQQSGLGVAYNVAKKTIEVPIILIQNIFNAGSFEQQERAHINLCCTIAHEMGHYIQDCLGVLLPPVEKSFLKTERDGFSAWLNEKSVADYLQIPKVAAAIHKSCIQETQADEAILRCFPAINEIDILKAFDLCYLVTHLAGEGAYKGSNINLKKLNDFIKNAHPSVSARCAHLLALMRRSRGGI